MFVRIAITAALAALAGLSPAPHGARAQGVDVPLCPETVGYVADLPNNAVVLPLVQSIYRQIGCSTTFVELPARRSLEAFNFGRIDGEMMRLPVIEARYHHGFVRSELALMTVQAAYWGDGDESGDTASIGFTMGIAWQENHVSEAARAVRFYDVPSKLRAYHFGSITHFVETVENVMQGMERGDLTMMPVMNKHIRQFRAFHYLDAEYADFMRAFDTALRARLGPGARQQASLGALD